VVGNSVLSTGRGYYYVALAVLLVGLWFTRNVWRGAFGRRLRAVRDNDDAARALTVSATAVRLQGFVVSGFIAGLGGAVYGGSLSLLTGAAFPIDLSINAAATAVVGGLGVMAGPLLGALYIIGVPRFIPLDSAELAATSLGWLLVILQFPGGIVQAFGRVRDGLVDSLARRAGLDPAVERGEETQAPVVLVRDLTTVRPYAPPADGAGPVLAASGLSRSFGGVAAVKEVSLAVSRGETVGLIGPNGAGKTTLFEMLSGFTTPDAGSVMFGGRDITRLTPDRRAQLGLVRSFQDAALFPTLSVLEAVSISLERVDRSRFSASLAGLVKPERRKLQRSYELVATMGLYPYRNTQIRALSTGTRHIAELTCLLAMEPEVLLLDEPSSGIAQRESEALGELLGTIKDELGVTLLIIEHDIPLIMSLSDRIIAMEAGAVIAAGPPLEVRHNPRVVESYLGGDLQAIERSGPAGPRRRKVRT
jgi:ABC-type branched-subunit amino acid transport system ATPase component